MTHFVGSLFCIAIICILQLSVSFQDTRHEKSAKSFSVLAHTIIAFFLACIFSDFCEGKPEYRTLSYVANTLTFVFTDVIFISFSAYISTLMNRGDKKWGEVSNPGVLFAYIGITVETVLAITGNLFEIDESGCYVEKTLAIIPYCLSALTLICLVIVIINNRKDFTKKQFIVIVVYMVLPFLGMFAEVLFQYYALTPITITLSVLLIYVMIQVSIIDEGKVRQKILEEISSTDLLTKLGNRRAYYTRTSAFTANDAVGVIFCDINGLKYTNDNFSHAEGDKLINRFSKLLTSVFETKDVFRISGDEFVVLIQGMEQQKFEEMAEAMRMLIVQNNSIASLGAAFGTGDCVEQLVSSAEGLMYLDKKQYHSAR